MKYLLGICVVLLASACSKHPVPPLPTVYGVTVTYGDFHCAWATDSYRDPTIGYCVNSGRGYHCVKTPAENRIDCVPDYPVAPAENECSSITACSNLLLFSNSTPEKP